MLGILEAIENWVREMLISGIEANLTRMFGDVNDKVGEIAAQVGQTPQGWNSSIFGIMQSLSETVILPIAGIIITYVLTIELITMVMDKNSFHDNVDTFMFFKYIFKAGAAVLIVAHTFDITMGIFDVAQHVVSRAAGVISGQTGVDIDSAIAAMNLEEYEIPELLLLIIETFIVSFAMRIMGVVITVILYGRMIEIYLTCSVAPIPMATITNKEWGQMGNNYLRGLMALAFQGFFLMLCVGIYAVLVNNMVTSDNIHAAVFSVASYTVMLCIAMMKTGTLAKSIFNAH
ncbi:MAG: CD0415/CD1112 family protein [Oscillospiraceae bacterium]|nr:CD0415/CD1112 family protein [Oscillospiraceae bacterium]